MNWANSNEIVKGIADGQFGPNGSVTREQLVTILYRYADAPAATGTDMSKFADAGSISDFAKDAFAWAIATGVISGNDNGTLNPNGTATHAEVATMFANSTLPFISCHIGFMFMSLQAKFPPAN